MDFSKLSKEEVVNQLIKTEAELKQTKQVYAEQLAEMELSQVALLEQEQNFREIFNSTYDAIIIHDSATGDIIDVNKTMPISLLPRMMTTAIFLQKRYLKHSLKLKYPGQERGKKPLTFAETTNQCHSYLWILKCPKWMDWKLRGK